MMYRVCFVPFTYHPYGKSTEEILMFYAEKDFPNIQFSNGSLISIKHSIIKDMGSKKPSEISKIKLGTKLEIRKHSINDLERNFSIKFSARAMVFTGLSIAVAINKDIFNVYYMFGLVLSFWFMNIFVNYTGIYRQKDRLEYLYFIEDCIDEIENNRKKLI